MSALDFMKEQPISDKEGWVDVDKRTLQHKKYRKSLSRALGYSFDCEAIIIDLGCAIL